MTSYKIEELDDAGYFESGNWRVSIPDDPEPGDTFFVHIHDAHNDERYSVEGFFEMSGSVLTGRIGKLSSPRPDDKTVFDVARQVAAHTGAPVEMHAQGTNTQELDL